MRITCPHCNRGLIALESAAATMKCPLCGGAFTLPTPPIDSHPEEASSDLSLAFDTNAAEAPRGRRSRNVREPERAVNYSKRTFYLILGIFIFCLVGSGLFYLFAIELPDQRFQRMWEAKRELFHDAAEKRMISLKRPTGTNAMELDRAKKEYLNHLFNMIDYCRQHRFLPSQSERLKALEEEQIQARMLLY